MSEVALYLDLSAQLMLHVGLQQLLLVQHLERDNKLGLLLPREVYMPELAPAEWLADLEIVDRPILGLELLCATLEDVELLLLQLLFNLLVHCHLLLVLMVTKGLLLRDGRLRVKLLLRLLLVSKRLLGSFLMGSCLVRGVDQQLR